MKSDRDSTYIGMRESETECLRREIARLRTRIDDLETLDSEMNHLRGEIARLRTRIADLEAQIAREQRKETRRLRSVS